MSDNNRTVSLEKLDEDAAETVRHLIECYEDNCFTKDERITLAWLALQARLRHQLTGESIDIIRRAYDYQTESRDNDG